MRRSQARFNANAAHHRVKFVKKLGERYWPRIEAIGQKESGRVHTGVYRPFTLRQRWIYMVVPVIGVFGSVAVGIDALRLSGSPSFRQALRRAFSSMSAMAKNGRA